MGDPALSLELWSSRSLSYTLADYSLDNFLVLFKQTFHRLITGQLVLIYIATRREASNKYVDKIWYIYIYAVVVPHCCVRSQQSESSLLVPHSTQFHTETQKFEICPPAEKGRSYIRYPLSATLIHRRRAKKRRANYTQYGQYISTQLYKISSISIVSFLFLVILVIWSDPNGKM